MVKQITLKKSFKDKTLGFISGVMVPTIPVILAAGLLLGIKAILVQSGVIQNVGGDLTIRDLNWYSGLIYIVSEIGIGFLGVFFCVTTVKYLGGNVLVGVFIGLALASPYIFGWGGWVLFDWGIITIRIQGYFSQIIPQICAGALYVYVDKWIKSWMPTAIDVVFRTGLAYIIVMASTFLVLGPILGIVEGLVSASVKWLGTLPYGIGTFIFALLWQPLVLTGMHIAVIMSIIANLPSPLYAVVSFAAFGQLGAAIAIAIKTKDSNIRKIIYGTVPSAILGITEPIIYGITLPRVKPFITGCIGGGIAGLIAGIMGIEGNVAGGMGILAITRVIPGGPKNIAFMVIGMILAILISLLLTLMISKERISEKKSLVIVKNKIFKYLTKNYKDDFQSLKKEELSNKINNMNAYFDKEKLDFIKNYEKQLSLESKYKTQIETILERRDERISQLNLKIEKLKQQQKIEKISAIDKKIKLLLANSKLKQIENQSIVQQKVVSKLSDEFTDLQDEFMNKVAALLHETSEQFNDKNIIKMEPSYFNAIHSLDISFGLTDKKQENIKVKSKKGV